MKLREVTGIHEIELSSVCNLACVYCPHPTLQRAKAHMPWHVLERAMQHVDYYCRKGTQGEVALTGIGEAILHPDFERAVAFVRSVIGGRLITLSTNGVAVDDAVLDVLQRYGVRVYVSLHRPEMASPAIHKMRQRGMPFGTNHAFVDSSLDWAGQVEWPSTAKSHICTYLQDGWAVVRQDGSVVSCCMDAHGVDAIGHIDDPIGSLNTRQISLCSACVLKLPPELLS